VRIFAHQKPEGYWESPAEPYAPKYKASYWQVMILGMLGLNKTDPRVRRAVEHVFQFQHQEGGFATCGVERARKEYKVRRERALNKGKELPSKAEWVLNEMHDAQLTCLTGNVCLALIRLGYASDKRVRRGLKWLVDVQNEDGGWLCPYWGYHAKEKHGCFMGTITPLDAFSELPTRCRNPDVHESLEAGVEFLLMHRLFKSDHHGFKTIKTKWLSFGFPQFFYDILRGLSVVCKIGHEEDIRIDDALRVLLEKQGVDGRWMLDSSLEGRMQTNLERKGKPSKWLTLKALRVVNSVYEARGSLP
jgi:hypothetical protein